MEKKLVYSIEKSVENVDDHNGHHRPSLVSGKGYSRRSIERDWSYVFFNQVPAWSKDRKSSLNNPPESYKSDFLYSYVSSDNVFAFLRMKNAQPFDLVSRDVLRVSLEGLEHLVPAETSDQGVVKRIHPAVYHTDFTSDAYYSDTDKFYQRGFVFSTDLRGLAEEVSRLWVPVKLKHSENSGGDYFLATSFMDSSPRSELYFYLSPSNVLALVTKKEDEVTRVRIAGTEKDNLESVSRSFGVDFNKGITRTGNPF